MLPSFPETQDKLGILGGWCCHSRWKIDSKSVNPPWVNVENSKVGTASAYIPRSINSQQLNATWKYRVVACSIWEYKSFCRLWKRSSCLPGPIKNHLLEITSSLNSELNGSNEFFPPWRAHNSGLVNKFLIKPKRYICLRSILE